MSSLLENPVMPFECLRCKHQWVDASGDWPEKCPKCKSKRWDRRPRKRHELADWQSRYRCEEDDDDDE